MGRFKKSQVLSLILVGSLAIASLAVQPSSRADDSGQGSSGDSTQAYDQLQQIAIQSLEKNVVHLKSGTYMRAGAHQFQALWTRDFVFASRGLMAIQRLDVVRDQLTLLLSMVRSDGLLPRYIDSTTTLWRYIAKIFGAQLPLTDHLKPQYSAGSNSGITMDSNGLMLLAAIQYVEQSGDWNWWNLHLPELLKVYHFYDKYFVDGLIVQGNGADWQDSVKRHGAIFYTNLIYWCASQQLKNYQAFEVSPDFGDVMKKKMIDTFFDPSTGLYRAIAGEPYISLDGNLMAIDLGFHPPASAEAILLWSNLRHHPLGTQNNGIMGAATYPNYPASWIEINATAVGLRHYHDSIYWSWLMGLSAKVAIEMGDRAASDAMFQNLEDLAVRDGWITEIYKPWAPFSDWSSALYRAEQPFSWGSGVILDALKAYRDLTAQPINPIPAPLPSPSPSPSDSPSSRLDTTERAS